VFNFYIKQYNTITLKNLNFLLHYQQLYYNKTMKFFFTKNKGINYLCSKILSWSKVFEPKKTVPVTSPSFTWIMLHNLYMKTRNIFEPSHDKTNIVRLPPAWIQTSLRIRAVWSGSILFTHQLYYKYRNW
jgi:hypothetical protein